MNNYMKPTPQRPNFHSIRTPLNPTNITKQKDEYIKLTLREGTIILRIKDIVSVLELSDGVGVLVKTDDKHYTVFDDIDEIFKIIK